MSFFGKTRTHRSRCCNFLGWCQTSDDTVDGTGALDFERTASAAPTHRNNCFLEEKKLVATTTTDRSSDASSKTPTDTWSSRYSQQCCYVDDCSAADRTVEISSLSKGNETTVVPPYAVGQHSPPKDAPPCANGVRSRRSGSQGPRVPLLNLRGVDATACTVYDEALFFSPIPVYRTAYHRSSFSPLDADGAPDIVLESHAAMVVREWPAAGSSSESSYTERQDYS